MRTPSHPSREPPRTRRGRPPAGFCQSIFDVLGCRYQRKCKCARCPGDGGILQELHHLLPWAAAGGEAKGEEEDEGSEPDAADLEWHPPTYVEAGAKYTGQWRANVRHGEGELERPDGGRYAGQFRRGRAHGTGKFVAANGNTYEGQWRADKAHGEGTFKKPNGSSYTGQWVDDRRSGRGSEEWSNGSCYTGEYLLGKKHGRGVYLQPKELQYEGQFRYDQLHGEGTYHWLEPDGRVYTGQWKDGEMSGRGKMTWSSGASYEGSYRANEKSGEGIFTWSDGRIYRGEWREGRQHGRGELFDKMGRLTSRGTWGDGHLVLSDNLAPADRSSLDEEPTESSLASINWREHGGRGLDARGCCIGS